MLPTSNFFAVGSRGPTAVPPSQAFRKLLTPLRNVEFTVGDEFFRTKGNTVARENGLRYESQVHVHLKNELGANYSPIELLVTEANGRVRKLIPDGIYFSHDVTVLFEVKLQHMPEAYWQLRHLYQPAMEWKRPKTACMVVEVCKSYDPSMPFPEYCELIHDLDKFIKSRSTMFGVLVWKP